MLRVGADFVLLCLAVLAALAGAPVSANRGGAAIVWLLPPLAVALLAARGAYLPTLQVRLLDRIAHVVGATSLAAMMLIAVKALSNPGLPELLVRAWIFGIVYLVLGKVVLELTQRRAQANRVVGKPTLIVGAGRVGAQVERRLNSQPELGLIPVGYLDPDPVPAELVPGRRAPILGDPSELGSVAEATGARHVVFAFLNAPDHVLVPLVRECEERGLRMSLVPRLFESINSRVELEHMGGLPLYGLRAIDPRGWQFAIKHFLGRALAIALLVLAAPVMLALALAVKLTSPGPVLFKQRRIGRDGHEFELLKFRSMREPEPADDGRSSPTHKRPALREVSDDVGPGGL
ncbi:MAG TPA: sugar transferase, partial [Thermoleophilaceae bacterium]|nr:sugar transferase [Thermoleophilaceae bacterium]